VCHSCRMPNIPFAQKTPQKKADVHKEAKSRAPEVQQEASAAAPNDTQSRSIKLSSYAAMFAMLVPASPHSLCSLCVSGMGVRRNILRQPILL